MKYLQITDTLVKDTIDSFVIDDITRGHVERIIRSVSTSYSDFIFSMLSIYSTGYVKLNSPSCPLGVVEVNNLMSKINGMRNVNVDYRNVIIADKIDLLYGTDVRSYAEFTKFTPCFYGTVETEVFDADSDQSCEMFLAAVQEIERLVSAIEQLVILSTSEEVLEDLIILGLGHQVGSLFILVY